MAIRIRKATWWQRLMGRPEGWRLEVYSFGWECRLEGLTREEAMAWATGPRMKRDENGDAT
jgi:hypothetical protein